MKVLLSWLREFAPDLSGDPFELGDVMSSLGLCCEEVQLLGGGLGGVVVAQVLALRPHPGADRIQLVDVDLGDGEPLQICCGAFNMAVGDKVPLATLGTVMPNGLEIARRKLRGEWSNGMLCSSSELGLGEGEPGILILPVDLPLGVPFTEAMGITEDVLFDLDLTPNRPDAFSIVGVARDLAAKLRVPFSLPDLHVDRSGVDVADLATVELLDPQLCGRFAVMALSNVAVGESDPLIARRLTLLGMRPINSIVDLSNYVMLEFGQPNHTFDLAKVPGGHLTVRRAAAGESLVTLDGVERALSVADGVIADQSGTPISLAGVMGGASTEISADTTQVLLEVAWWDPMSIAHTATRLGLRSEASSRFEKGVDPEIGPLAALRFAQLAAGLGATVHPGLVSASGAVPDRSPVLVRTERVQALLGSPISRDAMADALAPIGFTPSVTDSGDLLVELPSWRPDSTSEIDLVEEIARHIGFDHIEPTVPVPTEPGGLTADQWALRSLRDVLVAHGAAEVMPNPFLAPGDLERSGVRADAVVLSNPLAAEESVLRTSLLPGLLGTLGYNASHRNRTLRIFEVGHCYAQPTDGGSVPAEWTELAAAAAGEDATSAVTLVRLLLGRLGVSAPVLVPAEVPGLHPTRAAIVEVDGVAVGEVGEVDPDVAAGWGVEERVAWLRLDIGALFAADRPIPQMRPLSRFPSSDVDLAFVVPDDVPASLPEAALAAASPLVVSVALFDVFRSEAVGLGRRSLAYTVRLQAPDRTLTDTEVADTRAALIAAVSEQFGAELRA